MLFARFAIGTLWIGLMGYGIGVVSGQDYPNKPIRILTTGGGSSEFKTRLIAQGIAGPLGQPVIVEPRAAPLIGIELVSKAPPDGYTCFSTVVASGAHHLCKRCLTMQ